MKLKGLAMSKCCYKCEERQINCHSECGKYKEFLLFNEKKKALKRKEKAYDNDGRLTSWGYLKGSKHGR